MQDQIVRFVENADMRKKLKDMGDGTWAEVVAVQLYDRSPGTEWSFAGAAGGIVDTNEVVIKAGSPGLRTALTGLNLQNVHSLTSSDVVVKDGTAVIWRGRLTPGMVMALAFTSLRAGAGNDLKVACLSPGAAVYVNAQGYVG